MELEAYTDCLDRRAAARRLTVHPNTLPHRLSRISEILGLSVRDPEGLGLIVLALRQRRLPRN